MPVEPFSSFQEINILLFHKHDLSFQITSIISLHVLIQTARSEAAIVHPQKTKKQKKSPDQDLRNWVF